jgi:hypothetical protein
MLAQALNPYKFSNVFCDEFGRIVPAQTKAIQDESASQASTSNLPKLLMHLPVASF